MIDINDFNSVCNFLQSVPGYIEPSMSWQMRINQSIVRPMSNYDLDHLLLNLNVEAKGRFVSFCRQLREVRDLMDNRIRNTLISYGRGLEFLTPKDKKKLEQMEADVFEIAKAHEFIKAQIEIKVTDYTRHNFLIESLDNLAVNFRKYRDNTIELKRREHAERIAREYVEKWKQDCHFIRDLEELEENLSLFARSI